MSLSRDDMLRELELLPMWKLREPVNIAPVSAPATASPQAETKLVPSMPEPQSGDLPYDASPQELAAEDDPHVAHALTEALSPAEPLPEESFSGMPQGVTLGQGRQQAIMQMDWAELRDCVAHCQSCSLAETRTQTVFGVGDEHAEWLLVGEAPGAEEDRRGEPFVGQAGQLLDNMLAAIQLKRGENVYIANVLKCRPPQNRDPQGEEVLKCDPFLKRQVELIAPKLIVAMGRFAAQSLLNTTQSISALRGKLHDYYGVPVIVTYHPAYLLRNLTDKALAWEDLCFARSTMKRLQSEAAPPS